METPRSRPSLSAAAQATSSRIASSTSQGPLPMALHTHAHTHKPVPLPSPHATLLHPPTHTHIDVRGGEAMGVRGGAVAHTMTPPSYAHTGVMTTPHSGVSAPAHSSSGVYDGVHTGVYGGVHTGVSLPVHTGVSPYTHTHTPVSIAPPTTHMLHTRTASGVEGFANASAVHPLDSLSPSELELAACSVGNALVGEGHEACVGDLRVAEVSLQEPEKARVVAYQGCSRADESAFGLRRIARVVAHSITTGRCYEGLLDVGTNDVVGLRHLPNVQPSFSPEDYETCEAVVRAHDGFRHAVAAAGYDPDKVMIDPWSCGYFGREDDPSRRLCWALMYYKHCPDDNTYARPLEGLHVYVDLLAKQVIKFVAEPEGVRVAEPDEMRFMRYTPPPLQRHDLRDLVIVQPEGPSFVVHGQHVYWQNWSLRIGFTPQEGLVLHTVAYIDRHKGPLNGPITRPVLYRLSFAEMVVPYGDPAFPHYKKNAFDGGEDGLGENAHSLSLGCDCLGNIHYFDASLGPLTPGGRARTIKQAVCMHEEDTGMLWKHKDWRTDTSESRRGRRLVLSFMCTIGNYDYGFYYHLHLDGTIEMEVKLTGILSVGSMSLDDLDPRNDRNGHRKYGTTLHCDRARGTGLFAPLHQHIFVARIDTAIDGTHNRIKEFDSAPEPPGPQNPWSNTWSVHEKLLTSELHAIRDANLEKERFWVVESSNEVNRTGKPTAFKVMTRDPVTPMCRPDAAFMRRASFVQHTLWTTQYDPSERFPGDDFPNQDPRPLTGLPLWVQKDRPLVDEDLVVWLIFGAHHIPRLEDWPLMPCEKVSCMIKPFGFFDASPVMDLPAATHRQVNLSISNNEPSGGGGVPVDALGTSPASTHTLTAYDNHGGGGSVGGGVSVGSGGGGVSVGGGGGGVMVQQSQSPSPSSRPSTTTTPATADCCSSSSSSSSTKNSSKTTATGNNAPPQALLLRARL